MTTWQEFIEPSLYFGTHNIEDVERAIREEEMFLFATDKAAGVCVIQEYPRLTILHMPFCGGSLKELKRVIIPAAEQWGAERGVNRYTGCGRVGWSRAMADQGYETVGHFWSKEAPQ